jgi:predicted murein hydrolase (TIGR00659 family)
MTSRVQEIWVYLATSPLLGLTLTLLAYQGGFWLYKRSGMHPLANPVLLAVTALIAVLTLAGVPYDKYFEGAQFVHFLLGPATVALAVPLYANWARVRSMAGPIAVALIVGSVTATLSAVLIAHLLGASPATLFSLAPKSVTTPIAMAVAERIGGLPSLTAVLVIATGIVGAVVAGPLFNALGLRDMAVRGFAVGLASHGIGTARAFQVSPTAGAFAALAMGLNGVVTALLVPMLMPWVKTWLGVAG